jgi:predicted PurR-regulated permease PerM
MLSIAQDIILPLLYAFILAILISPAVEFLVKHNINRTIAIAGVMLFCILILVAILPFLLSQISRLSEAMPQLSEKFETLLHGVTKWVSTKFNIRESTINAWIANTKTDLIDNSGRVVGTTLSTIGGLLATTFLTPVYVFMILYYQKHLLDFVHKAFSNRQNIQVDEIFSKTKTIIQSYLAGLFAEFVIIAVLNSLGLLILGIPYAILLGVIGALLNIIPYIGGLVAVGLYMIVALITRDPASVAYVALLYMFIQFIDNNFIVPKIVGSRVKLNALISIIAVIFGAALWGIPGMFLSIPITAILKVVFDRVKSLSHWGFLLGDTTSPSLNVKK